MSDKPTTATKKLKKDGSGSAKSTPRPSKPKASKKGKEGPLGGLSTSAPVGMGLPSLSLPPPDGSQTAQSSLSTLDGAQAALGAYGPEQLKADEALLQQLAALMQPLREAARITGDASLLGAGGAVAAASMSKTKRGTHTQAIKAKKAAVMAKKAAMA